MTTTTPRTFALTDRYERSDGDIYLSGLQALVRIPLDQYRLDRQAGRTTGTLISGYEGSPLAGYDLELKRRASLMDAAGVVLRPSVNEELGANAIQGSQLASASKDRTVDGVVGIWYGKAPGLDRATDALRHGNLGGADPDGGVLVLVGDDSIAKSSTVPSSSESAMAEIGMTVLSPSDPQDVLDLGLHGIALSRFCGLWTGLKLATNVVDGYGSVRLSDQQIVSTTPSREINGRDYRHAVSAHFLQPGLGELEASAVLERTELAKRYARENDLNPVFGDPAAKVGIISAGATYLDVLQALRDLGISLEEIERSGIRLLKLGMVAPLDHEAVRSFAAGLDEVVVVEEKRPFVELAVKDALYGAANAPTVSGRRAPDGTPLLRQTADLPPEVICAALAPRLVAHLSLPTVTEWAARHNAAAHRKPLALLSLASRTPYFCSGCPHNRSTEVPPGSLVGAGIGCSALAALMPGERTGDVIGFTQMGGEGASWIGMSPFVRQSHLFQNMGDGTFHHSGSLALRAAVASNTTMTFKILYNDTVAMTGGQDAVGKLSVEDVVSSILIEGVRRVVITTDDPRKYRRRSLPSQVEVRHRDDLVTVQKELAKIEGVTAIVHDQECATELRRKRKRGKASEPELRAFINERVCEGCGDCGTKSNCLSVQPVDTEFGRKTQIHQASCNKDYSCLDGDCPSFITVKPGKQRRTSPSAESISAGDLPKPALKVPVTDFNMRITGVGGTGVVTTAQVLATAATLSGYYVRGLDQMGMAQKGGAVVSDLRLSPAQFLGANKVGEGTCDLYLGCDLLVAADDGNLSVLSPERSIAITSTSKVPTGLMVTDPEQAFPDIDDALAKLHLRVRADDSLAVDARERALAGFGDDQYANVFLVGVAVQAGALPIDPAFIEQALEMNGVKVETNIQAFRLGRHYVIDPDAVASTQSPTRNSREEPFDLSHVEDMLDVMDADHDDLASLLRRRAGELTAYQDRAYAERYVREVVDVHGMVQERVEGDGVAIAYATYLFKLMAYKDEYEVARLSLDPALTARLTNEFGADAKFYYRLHPPILRALGLRKKVVLGPWFRPVFGALYSMRRLRGTKLDVFGIGSVRRLERALPSEYSQHVRDAVALLVPSNEPQVRAIVELPDRIRGYELIKTASVERYRAEVDTAMKDLRRGASQSLEGSRR